MAGRVNDSPGRGQEERPVDDSLRHNMSKVFLLKVQSISDIIVVMNDKRLSEMNFILT